VDKERLDQEAPSRPTVTFMGNTYDLASLGALASGGLLLFLCLTCNQGMLCLPAVPIAAGVIGLLSAKRAVDEKRTRLWSWLGIGAGGLAIGIMVAGIIAWVGLIFAGAILGGN